MTGEMTMSVSSAAMLLLLGAFHGINPGMGWLFAVALGMQERRRTAVCWAGVAAAGSGTRAGSCGSHCARDDGGRGDAAAVGALDRGRDSCCVRHESTFPSSPSELGEHEGQQSRADLVVVPDGVRSRCGFDGGATVPWNGYASRGARGSSWNGDAGLNPSDCIAGDCAPRDRLSGDHSGGRATGI